MNTSSWSALLYDACPDEKVGNSQNSDTISDLLVFVGQFWKAVLGFFTKSVDFETLFAPTRIRNGLERGAIRDTDAGPGGR